MKLSHILNESPDAKLRNDPKLSKMVRIAIMHDSTIPRQTRVKLGPKLTDAKAMELWLDILENKINTGHQYQLIDQEKKFYEWITRLYINNTVQMEDITSRGVEALMTWYVLSRRGLLKPEDADFNKFTNFKSFETAMSKYNETAAPFKDEEITKRLYKDSKSIEIVNNDDYVVTIPLNYNASCKFARSTGTFANWCTGTLSTKQYFDQYSNRGPLIIFQSKTNPEDKYQLHAPSDQFKNIQDREIRQPEFAKKYPNAIYDIVNGMVKHKAQLAEIWPNIDDQIRDVEQTFANAIGKDIKIGDTVSLNGKIGRVVKVADQRVSIVTDENDPDEITTTSIDNVKKIRKDN